MRDYIKGKVAELVGEDGVTRKQLRLAIRAFSLDRGYFLDARSTERMIDEMLSDKTLAVAAFDAKQRPWVLKRAKTLQQPSPLV